MEQKKAEPRTESRSGRLNLPSLLVVLWVFRRAKRGEDRDRPQIVGTSAVSAAVVDRAKQLAANGREDAQAVDELRALASGKRKTLRQAEKASRFLGYHHELRQANLANRLLKATLSRQPVPTIVPRDEERINIVEAFDRLPRSEQWTRLTQLQPVLLVLENDFRTGRFGKVPAIHRDINRDQKHMRDSHSARRKLRGAATIDRPSDDEMQRRLEFASIQNQLIKRLKRLVGPTCDHGGLLLSSQRALDAAHLYLLHPEANER